MSHSVGKITVITTVEESLFSGYTEINNLRIEMIHWLRSLPPNIEGGEVVKNKLKKAVLALEEIYRTDPPLNMTKKLKEKPISFEAYARVKNKKRPLSRSDRAFNVASAFKAIVSAVEEDKTEKLSPTIKLIKWSAETLLEIHFPNQYGE